MRIRGNAPQVYEKYLNLARDATASGDRIAAESYYQFAEHYFRIINDSTDPQRHPPQQRPQSQPQSQPEQPNGAQAQPRVDWPAEGDGQVNGSAATPKNGEDSSAEALTGKPDGQGADGEGAGQDRRRGGGRSRGPRRRGSNGANGADEAAPRDAAPATEERADGANGTESSDTDEAETGDKTASQ